MMSIDGARRRPDGVAGVVAAAGLSSRMGDFKPLLPFRGKTLIESSVQTLRDGGAGRIFLITGHRAESVETLFSGEKDVVCLRNPEYRESDMFASVKIGLRQAGDFRWVLFLPGDVPAAAPSICRVLRERAEKEGRMWARPYRDGRGQHPLLLSKEAVRQILTYAGDGGLRGALHSLPEPPMEIPVRDPGCGIDVDTREQYRALLRYERERRGDASGS